MKKEEFVASLVMTIVSVMVLIGVTIAWFSSSDRVFSKGMRVKAAELSSVKIALTPGGEDISELAKDDVPDNEFAEIGLEDLINVENGKMAPGVFGDVTFYVTPEEGVTRCAVVPVVQIQQGTGTWYPDIIGGTEGDDTIQELCEQVGRHISFYSDEAMTAEITEGNPYVLTWSTIEEKTAVIYWKWHYEYPFTTEQNETLSAGEKKALIDLYDIEDTNIGKNVSNMKFYFTFIVQ